MKASLAGELLGCLLLAVVLATLNFCCVWWRQPRAQMQDEVETPSQDTEKPEYQAAKPR